MKQKIVGSYYAGNDSVQLVLRDGSGGEFYRTPEDGAIARIRIGADDSWEGVFGILTHEIFELIIDKLRFRFKVDNDFSNSYASYLFVFNHQDFSDICARSAEFIDLCLPDLKREYKNWHKKKK